jgi:hypothetical protein
MLRGRPPAYGSELHRLMNVHDRPPGARLAYILICLAAFASSWNGTRLLGRQPVDVLLSLAIVIGCLALLVRTRGLPRWITVPTLIIVALAVLHVLAPTDPLYMAQRFQPDGGQLATVEAESSVAKAVQWLLALAGLPWLVANVTEKAERPVEPIITASVIGASVSAGIALSDYFGYSNVGEHLLGYINTTGRESGLASHSNNLGFACLVAAPFAIRLMLRRRRRFIGLVSFAALVGGVVVSGSRGAQLGMAGVLLLCLLRAQAGRRLLWPALYVAAWICVAYLIFMPELSVNFSKVLRFASEAGTAASNSQREMLITQGLRDFFYAPVTGIGFEVLTAAHSVYVQLLASGGLLLLGAMGYFWLGLIRGARRLARQGEILGDFIFCSTLAWLIVGAIENQLTDRYLYFPTAVAVALLLRLGPVEQDGDRGELRSGNVDQHGAAGVNHNSLHGTSLRTTVG